MGDLAPRRIEALYLRHADGALRFAYLLSGSREAAEDAVHEAFLRAFSRFADLRSDDAFGAYLRRTILNLKRMESRHESVKARRLPAIAVPASAPAGHSVEERTDVLRALAALPPRQRAAIVLRYYEDMSEARAADVMGCSVSALKSLVARASEALRIALEGSRHGT